MEIQKDITINKAFGTHLAYIRQTCNLTQAKMSRIVGSSTGTLLHIEQGLTIPSKKLFTNIFNFVKENCSKDICEQLVYYYHLTGGTPVYDVFKGSKGRLIAALMSSDDTDITSVIEEWETIRSDNTQLTATGLCNGLIVNYTDGSEVKTCRMVYVDVPTHKAKITLVDDPTVEEKEVDIEHLLYNSEIQSSLSNYENNNEINYLWCRVLMGDRICDGVDIYTVDSITPDNVISPGDISQVVCRSVVDGTTSQMSVTEFATNMVLVEDWFL